MAYTTFTTTMQPASGAFTFIKSFHDALITAGLTQTADTGQLDLSTAGPTRNATANFSYGYTVYKLPSVSGLNDVFIRINHTNNNDATPISYLPRITVGTGTDGAGAINANSTGELALSTTSVLSTSGVSTHYVSVTDGDLAIAFAAVESVIGVSQTYTLSRLRELDGTKKSGYWLTYHSADAINNIREYIYTPDRTTLGIIQYTAAATTNNRFATSLVIPFLWFGETSNLNIGADIPVFPPTILTPAATTALPLLWSTNDVTVGSTFTATRFGVSRTFLRVYGYPWNTNISQNIILE